MTPHRIIPTVLLLLTAVGSLSAQVQYRQSPANLLPSQTQTVAGPTAPYVNPPPTYVPTPTNPYPGYPTVQGPVGSTLNGTANVINAQGQYNIQYQQARMMNQDVERAKIQTQQMLRDQMRYEEAIKPKAEDVREQDQQNRLRRARNNPPLNEIWSARSLNELLAEILKTQNLSGARGPLVPLESSLVAHLNLSAQPSERTPAVLRDGGKLSWPLALQDPRFNADREKLDMLMPQAVKEVQGPGPQFATFTALRDGITTLTRKIDTLGPDLPLPDIISCQRYTQELSNAMNLLKEPNAKNYFNGSWEAKGASVGELVEYMNKNGLKFSPAGPEDQQFYTAFYSALVTYDSGLYRLVRR